MGLRLKRLTSTSVFCILFLLFFPLAKWYLLAAFAIADFLLYSFNQKRNLPVFGLFFIILILSSCLFYPDIMAIVCMSLCSFFFHAIKVDPSIKVGMTGLLLGIHLLNQPSLGLLIVLIAVFFIQIILTIILTSHNKVHLFRRLQIMLVLGIVSSMMMVFIPYLVSGIRNLLSIVIVGFATLISKGYHQLFDTEESDVEKLERSSPLSSASGEWETYPYKEYVTNPYLYLILMILLAIAFIAAIIFIVKRRKAMQLEMRGTGGRATVLSSALLKKDQKNGRAAKPAPPSNIPIRMLVYKFEKKMKGMQRRKHGESFHEWLNRIHSSREDLNSRLTEIYEKARYGEEDIPKDEVRIFSDGLKQIMKQLN